MDSQPSDHKKFAILASDVVIFTIREGKLLVRLMHVKRPPHFPNGKGFPGGLIRADEMGAEAARRIVRDRGGLRDSKLHIEQFRTFTRVDRDPRGRVVAIGYIGLVPWNTLSAEEAVDSEEAFWVEVNRARHLAYDHDRMLTFALKHLHLLAESTTAISRLLPKEFTLTDLERAYSCILGTALDKRNFRKKILKLGIIEPIKGKRTGGAFRPAQLYKFSSNNVEEIEVL